MDKPQPSSSGLPLQRDSVWCVGLLGRALRDAVFLVRAADGQILDANHSALEAYGYDRASLLTMTVQELSAPEARNPFPDRLAAAAAGDALFETTHRRKDGSTFPVEVSSRLTEVAGERVLIGVIRDTTERRRTEESLRLSQERYRQVFEASPDAIALIAPDGCITAVNRATARMFLYGTPDQLVGMHATQVIAPHGRERGLQILRRRLAGEEIPPVEYELLRSDGTTFFGETSAEILRDPDGDVAGYLCVTRNVTERKQSETALRESEAKFRAVIENSNDGIILADADGTILWRSPFYRRINGYHDTERIGHSILVTVHPDDRENVARCWAELVSDPTRLQRAEYRLLHKDGGWRWIESTAKNLLSNPDVRAIIITSRDITEQREANAAKARLEKQLLQSQKMEAVGQLAGGIAHDFNNILAAMMMHLNILQLQPDMPPEELRQDVDDLLVLTDRAANLTRQLLLFSRREAMKIGRHDLNILVESLAEFMRRLLGEQVSLVFDQAAEPLWFDGDASMIEQVVTNLCLNARDAMPRGGLLGISTATVEFDADSIGPHATVQQGRFICLQVSDNGVGIAPTIQGRIFEPFFTTKAQGKGTGLGLATVHGIVAEHGGFVEVTSRLGEGSTFSVYLPRAAPAHASDTFAKPAAARGGMESVLIVEDEPAVRAAAVRCLRRLGYHVAEAANGPEALKVWSQSGGQFDLLFTDVVMPEGMSGLELAALLAKQRPGLRTIITTGHSPEALDSDDDAHDLTLLRKPYDVATLAAAVRTSLDRSR